MSTTLSDQELWVIASLKERLFAVKAACVHSMVELFGELKQTFAEQTREVAIVMKVSGKAFAVAVDAIESVVRLARDSITNTDELALATFEKTLVTGVARYGKNNELVIALDEHAIMA